ncbi:MAG: response regulator [Deltaproteobacteria bacterium]|nr:response regulator [Deltaproteobacteria bacterium]MCB9787557.1 response regulator [Deltaproteobacteria bacterium]
MTTQDRPSRILYVEDDADIREVTVLALSTLDSYDVCACESGTEALARAADFAPDLVLLDVMMPGLDGPATFRALRELPSLARTPVAFMSARADARDRAAYDALGAVGLIEKPFDPMDLGEAVARLWRRARPAGERAPDTPASARAGVGASAHPDDETRGE